MVDDQLAVQPEADVTALVGQAELVPLAVLQGIVLVEQHRGDTVLEFAELDILQHGVVLHEILGVGVHAAEADTHVAVHGGGDLVHADVEAEIKGIGLVVQLELVGARAVGMADKGIALLGFGFPACIVEGGGNGLLEGLLKGLGEGDLVAADGGVVHRQLTRLGQLGSDAEACGGGDREGQGELLSLALGDIQGSHGGSADRVADEELTLTRHEVGVHGEGVLAHAEMEAFV